MDPLRAITLSVMLVVSLALGTVLVGSITDATRDNQADTRVQTAALLDGTQWVAIGDNYGINQTVVDSRGYAVKLAGAPDSYVKSSSDIRIADDSNFTLSVWASVDGDATATNMTAVSLDGRVVVSYNRSSDTWTGYYYETGSTQSYQVNVTDTTQPNTLANVMVVANGTHLAIYHNNTLGEVESITATSQVAAPVNTSSWNGRVEEVRTFAEPLNASKRQRVYQQPVRPVVGVSKTARIMFDQPQRDTQYIFYTTAELVQSNVTFSQGLPGHTMQEGDFAALGADYKWATEGPQIKPIPGGELDGAPVAYVEYTFKTEYADLGEMFSDFAVLGAILPLLLVALPLFAYIQKLRG